MSAGRRDSVSASSYGDGGADNASASADEIVAEPEKGWFFVEEWSPARRVGSPTEDQVEEILQQKRATVEKEVSMLPAWRQSFLKKMQAKAVEEEINDGYVPYNWADHLARPDPPSGLMATALTPLGEQIWRKDTRTTAQKKALDLRRVFDRIDKDGDGYLSAQDIAKTMKSLGSKGVRLSETKRIVFENDDDADGKVGWEEFSNLWVRLKKPLSFEDSSRPMELFNLMDFLHNDIIYGKDNGAINSNKMLQLFHFRYQKVAALEVMDDVSVGETGEAGVPYPEFVKRDEKLRKVMFTTNRYGALQKQDLAELHVSTHPNQGCSGTLRRVRPATPDGVEYEYIKEKRSRAKAKRVTGIEYGIPERKSLKERKEQPKLMFSYNQLFEGQRYASRSPLRQRSFVMGQLDASERTSSKLDELKLTDVSRPGTPGSVHSRLGRTNSAGSVHSTSSMRKKNGRSSQLARVPKMSERLRESRHGPRHKVGVEVREQEDTSFVAAMQVTIEPGEEAHVAIMYGPIAVYNVLGRKALKVGTLHAGEVVPVFESVLDDTGVSLRTSLGWFSQIAANGRLAVDKLSGEDDPRHPSNQASPRRLGDLSGLPQMEESKISHNASSPVPFGSLGTDLLASTMSAEQDLNGGEDIYNW
eukprot:COSAG02_NODE_1765_length_11024_cov_1680.688879_2_plen_644_part_00